MNSFLVSELRLALGVEPIDALLGGRVARPLQVELEGSGHRFTRHESGRYSLARWLGAAQAGPTSPLDLRIFDRRRGYVPRRLRVHLPPVAEVASGRRIRRPALYPGVAWDLVGNATALRSRVLRDGAPVRWACVEARRPGAGEDDIVIRTRADDRGEFLLVLASDTIELSELEPIPGEPIGSKLMIDLELDLRIHGPASAPVPPPASEGPLDPLWDLPLDELELPADPVDPEDLDPVAAGHTIPDGWVPLVEHRIRFALGHTISDQSSFVI
ncbi:MAG TPA: hypothetical protein VK034_19515 [Enhygromyxa sp.]|nr:hypothetical protein [Enhygromyxa sp.]